MSTEIVSQFFLAVSSDSALKEKLATSTDSVNFVKIAQASGYSFSLEDLQTYVAQHNNGELSEDELQAVAGGKGCPKPCAGGGNWPPISAPKGPGTPVGGFDPLLLELMQRWHDFK